MTLSVASSGNTIVGTEGRDSLSGTATDDTLLGLGGNDRLNGADGNDTLLGGEGKDILSGGAHADTLDGGSGEDRLDGGDGNDVLAGGDGADQLTGGFGADTFVFNAGETGVDTITDFTLGEDAIDISGLIGDTYGVVSSDLADFVQIVDPGGKGKNDPILQVDVTGTGEAFVDVAELNGLDQGYMVSVTLTSTTTSDIEII